MCLYFPQRLSYSRVILGSPNIYVSSSKFDGHKIAHVGYL